jgi:hypothetical protein
LGRRQAPRALRIGFHQFDCLIERSREYASMDILAGGSLIHLREAGGRLVDCPKIRMHAKQSGRHSIRTMPPASGQVDGIGQHAAAL